jgi:UDP-glucose 4-epimerase
MTSRVVVIGAGGFVGGAIADRLELVGREVLRIERAMLDLLAPTAAEHLAGLIRVTDSLVFAAAEAPCKNPESLQRNVALVFAVLMAVQASTPAFLLNVSSDAVYLDSPLPLAESSSVAPDNLHGAMHSAREALLNSVLNPVLHLRPTLIYGFGDPHNGYGPNQFLSRARAGINIELFGNGEERRDHVHINDVVNVAVRCLETRPTGALNVASGEVQSFRAIAEHVVKLHDGAISIQSVQRTGPMPHGGYRPIAVDRLRVLFPDFIPLTVLDGVAREVASHGT